MPEALRILDAGLEILAAYAPTMVALLASMAAHSRMVTAIAPLRPLRAASCHTTPVVSLAYVNGLVHRFLISTAERFRFRAYILARCFGVATRYMWMYSRRVKIRPDLERDWAQIEALRRDLGTLTADSIEQYQALVRSFSAARRGSPPRS